MKTYSRFHDGVIERSQANNGGEGTNTLREQEKELIHKPTVGEEEESEPQSMNCGPLLTSLSVRENEQTHNPQIVDKPSMERESRRGHSSGFPASN